VYILTPAAFEHSHFATLFPWGSKEDGMDLGAVIEALYESEINCSVSTFWDAGIIAQLGDEMNGFVAQQECQTTSEAAEFLDRAAREKFPDSAYTLGKAEWERRNQARQDRHRNN
jgi:hypothetical protein